MILQWVGCDAMTGRVIADLPISAATVGANLVDFWSGTASLAVPDAPRDWQSATIPMGCYIVLLGDGLPLWGGWITNRKATDADTVELSIASWEAYLERRYVGDATFSGVDQCQIVASMIEDWVAPGGPALEISATPSAIRRDRTYADSSNKTVMDAMQELSGVDRGPEWTVEWRAAGPSRYTPVIQVADRIGVTPRPGLGPAAVFELPGSMLSFSRVEDWAVGSGANRVVAAGSAAGDGTGDGPAMSAPATIDDPRRPVIEWRWTPSTSTTGQDTLDSHARATVALMSGGASSMALSASWQAAPRLGAEWGLGDIVGYRIVAPSVCGQTASGDSVPLAGIARVIAWEVGLDEPRTITPILSEDVAA